jgi:hypothetical protein
VRLGRAILTFALAVLWLAMPVHCQIEAISAGAIFACVDEVDCSSEKDPGCEDDFCDSVESPNYFHQKAPVLGKAPLLAAVLLAEPTQAPLPEFEISHGSDSVPLLHSGWQFAYRAAGSPRAPSLTA